MAVPTLLIEFQSSTAEQAAGDYAAVEQAVQRACGAPHGASCEYFEDARKLDEVCITDICMPLSKLAQCIANTEADFHAHGLLCIICAHIADGNFHCNVPYQPHELKLVQQLLERLMNRAILAGGTVSGEHGVGVGKMDAILKEHGATCIHVMRQIKKALDPNSIMNPNKIFPLQAHL
ncbi:hypothetical protein CYMTET_40367 [Cymbomonas tetramitiformis]|uniref:D-lactate dehydrogenase (cytochrome) n=1 Tax=Cymbomonas tetramitiformis TaxID=36881 RepID=A0AAE0C9F8_9CHLO|nr:hypothetical protein CYMTET_40367 [Cymbomonas tetramitiformis]